MLKLGSTGINKVYWGSTDVGKLYLGSNLVFDGSASGSLTPILTNFTVSDANKDRIYFSSPLGAPTGLTVSGFKISDNTRTISSVTLNGTATSGHYFTVSTPFTYWEQGETIRLESGDGIVHDFRMEHIRNNISYPVTSPTVRYVSVSGSGTQNGESESNAWTLEQAIDNASGGMHIHVKAGDYGVGPGVGSSWDFYTITGTSASNPVTFEGYKTSPGDISTNYYDWDSGNAVSSTEMPTLSGVTYGMFTGFGSVSGMRFMNFNIEGAEQGLIMSGGTDFWYERINSVGDGVDVEKCIQLYGSSTQRVTMKSCNAVNGRQIAAQCSTSHSLYEDNNVFGSLTGSARQDYYFTAENNTKYTTFLNNHSKGDGDSVSHWEHGFSLSGESGAETEYNLIDGHTITGSPNSFNSLEFRRDGSRYNVARNLKGNNVAHAIRFRDGAYDNVLENSYFDVALSGVVYLSTSEAGDVGSAYRNKVINCIFNDVSSSMIYSKATVVGYDGIVEDNEIINCTFYNPTKTHSMTDKDTASGNTHTHTGNTVTNCQIVNVDTSGNSINDFTFSYTNIYNSWDTTLGTNSSNVNPDFVDAANDDFEPQATFINIDAPRDSSAKYDYDGNERSTTTTIGAVKHADEQAIPDTTAPAYVSSVVEDAAPSSLVMTYDEALDEASVPATTDFSVSDGAANAVTNVAVSGTTVTLTLTNAIENGDTVTVSYTKGTNPLQDAEANECVNLTNESVTNNVDAAETLGPEKLTDPSFDDAVEWSTAFGYFSVTGGQAVHNGTGTDYVREVDATLYSSGTQYKIVVDVASNSGTGANNIQFQDSGEEVSATHLDAGVHTFYHTMSADKIRFLIYGRSNAPIVINSVSVKEVL